MSARDELFGMTYLLNGIWIIARLTLHEVRGRKVAQAAALIGVAFLLVFGIGFALIYRDASTRALGIVPPRMQASAAAGLIAMLGLYAVNFLVAMLAVLVPVDTLAGEIRSGAIQTLAAKPVTRAQIVLGKWLGFALVIGVYLLLLAGGVMAIVGAMAGGTLVNLPLGLALMLLKALVLLTLCILGGTRLSTLANGVLCFGVYGLAFIGGWLEQIGTLLGNGAAQNVGVVTSLLMPGESMWQLAAYRMQPTFIRDLSITPFSITSVPSPAMIAWALGYVGVLLIVAIRLFRTRDL